MRLTLTEKQWLWNLQIVLDKCPSNRFGFYTIGDAQVIVYDRTKEKEINALMDDPLSKIDFPTAVERAKAETDYRLDFPANVHSVAG